jgi:pimeloyl-ACP methyl ester carboxylesterase
MTSPDLRASPDWASWERRESGPTDAAHTVLLLPGGMCTAMQYEEVMAEPALADVRLVAVTLPGNGGRPPLEDDSVESYARLTAELAADVGGDVVVGFSMGANVALEMAGSGAFSGPVVLLAPSFSRADEAAFLRVLDRAARVLGHLPFSVMLKFVDQAVKDSPLPPERLEALVADLRANDPRVVRSMIHEYLRYLGRYGSVAPRLAEAGVPAWVVHGEKGDGGITPGERRTLEPCPQIQVITLPGTSFFMPNEEPTMVAGLVRDALTTVDSAELAPREGQRE